MLAWVGRDNTRRHWTVIAPRHTTSHRDGSDLDTWQKSQWGIRRPRLAGAALNLGPNGCHNELHLLKYYCGSVKGSPPSTMLATSKQMRIWRQVISEACFLQSSETNKTCRLISKQDSSTCFICGSPWCLQWFSRAVRCLGPLLTHFELEKGGHRSTTQLPSELWRGLQGTLLSYFTKWVVFSMAHYFFIMCLVCGDVAIP